MRAILAPPSFAALPHFATSSLLGRLQVPLRPWLQQRPLSHLSGSPGVIGPNYALTGFDECTTDQITAIKNGFTDMITPLMADNFGRYPTVDWDGAAAQDLFGPTQNHHPMTRYLLCLTAFCHLVFAGSSSSASSTLAPTTTVIALETGSPGVISPNYALTGFDECTTDQITAIKNGFTDMITLLMADDYGHYPTVDWNGAAAQDFFGPWEKNNGFREDLVANFNRAAAVTYQWWLNPFATRLHARCDDPDNLCECTGGPGETEAYTRHHEPDINFCPGYFRRPPLPNAIASPEEGQWEYVYAFHNQGWPGIPYKAGAPSGNTPAYGDEYTKWAAQNPGGLIIDATDNADNYAHGKDGFLRLSSSHIVFCLHDLMRPLYGELSLPEQVSLRAPSDVTSCTFEHQLSLKGSVFLCIPRHRHSQHYMHCHSYWHRSFANRTTSADSTVALRWPSSVVAINSYGLCVSKWTVIVTTYT
nr:hypothetical protein CFP56_13357 [Quercus suber]